MNIKLKLFLILICLFFDLILYKKIQTNKLELKYSLKWYLVSFILILITIFDKLLIPLKDFLGFETTSNMIFLFGFFLLTMIIFSQTQKLSEQADKITKLTQEIALMKKDVNHEKTHK